MRNNRCLWLNDLLHWLRVNEARREMFVKEGRGLENIPPTVTAPYQHVFGASFIAVYVLDHSLIACPPLPNIENNGWKLVKGVCIPGWKVTTFAGSC